MYYQIDRCFLADDLNAVSGVTMRFLALSKFNRLTVINCSVKLLFWNIADLDYQHVRHFVKKTRAFHLNVPSLPVSSHILRPSSQLKTQVESL